MESIDIADGFSGLPAGRLREDAAASDAALRDLLEAALKRRARWRRYSNGIASFGPSFLEEVFGGLVRVGRLDKAFLDEQCACGCE